MEEINTGNEAEMYFQKIMFKSAYMWGNVPYKIAQAPSCPQCRHFYWTRDSVGGSCYVDYFVDDRAGHAYLRCRECGHIVNLDNDNLICNTCTKPLMPHPEYTQNGLLYIEEKKTGGLITTLQGFIYYQCGECCKKRVEDQAKRSSNIDIKIPNYAAPMSLSLCLGWCPPIAIILLTICLVLLIIKKGKREKICYAIGIMINLAWLGFFIIYTHKK